MGVEIERKFLVKNVNFKREAFKEVQIKQGFLNSDKKRVVRVRLTHQKGYLTIKGVSNASGVSRFEWEKEISVSEAQALLDLCEPNLIVKSRFYIKHGNHIFEVDEFFENNKGLIIAEVELQHENESFERPIWLGVEVTGERKYYNSSLSKNPFSDW